MNCNFYESELRKILHVQLESNRISELGDSSPFFERLMKEFPFSGSRIDWRRVPESIERVEDDRALQIDQFILFCDEIIRKFDLVGAVVYVGDSATDFALVGTLECMREALPALLAIPQHHYLIGIDNSWCMCFTMEGDMGFGFSLGYRTRTS
jgi:hypothetical protein